MFEVLNNVYLCKYSDVKQQNIEKLGITHIINLSQMKINKNVKAEILNLDIPDTEDFNILNFFDQTNKYISENSKNGHKVLVCCLACISRSPTIILAYLIKSEKLSYPDAYLFLENINPRISPNDGFKDILEKYE